MPRHVLPPMRKIYGTTMLVSVAMVDLLPSTSTHTAVYYHVPDPGRSSNDIIGVRVKPFSSDSTSETPVVGERKMR